MSDSAHSLSLDQRKWLDKICSRFEHQFLGESDSSSERLTIEQMISAAESQTGDQNARRLLLEELVLTELELRESAGEQLEHDQYYARFPTHRELIDSAFRRHRQNIATWKTESAEWTFDADDPDLRYVRQSELARGGMGIVYRGYDRVLQRPVAIKVLDASLLGDEEALKRFHREPKVCGNLQHPNVVPVYDNGTTREGLPYFVMRLIRGRTLAELLHESKIEFGSDAALEIFQQVCHAIAAAHRQGIIHRDIKPSNIMVADLGEVYVMDWGLSGFAKTDESVAVATRAHSSKELDSGAANEAVQHESSKDEYLTASGKIFGTPRYMPPEFGDQLSDRSSRRADVYCLGSVLCELLLGQTPKQLLGGSSTSGTDLVPDLVIEQAFRAASIDQALLGIVQKATRNDPAERPESADQLVQAIEEYRRDVRNRVRQAELDSETLRHKSRITQLRIRIVAVIAASLLCISTIGGWAWNRGQLAKAQRTAEAAGALANAQLAFELACNTQSWKSSEWVYSDQIFDSAASLINQLGDPELLAKSERLRKQKEFMKLFQKAMTLKTDLRNNVFHYPNQNECIAESLQLLVGDNKVLISQVIDSLAAYPKNARQLIAATLIQWTKSSQFPKNTIWGQLVPAIEFDEFGSNVSEAVIADDVQRLSEFAESERLYEWPAVVIDSLALKLWDLGEIDSAEKVFRIGKTRFPSDFRINTNYGNFLSLEFSDAPSKSLPYLATAASLNPNPGSMYNYAGSLQDVGDHEMAADVLAAILKQHPEYYAASIALANSKTALGDREGAIEVLNRSIAQGNSLPDVFFALAQLHMEMSHWKSAEENLRILQKTPGMEHGYLGEMLSLYNQMGLYEQSIALGTEYLKTYGDVASLNFYVGKAYSDIGQVVKAIEYYNKDLEFSQKSAQTTINIGDCLRKQGRFDEALKYYVRGHELSIGMPDWDFPSMAWIREVEKNAADAQNLANAIARVKSSGDVNEIGKFIGDTLLPLQEWNSAYQLANDVLDDENLRNAGLFTLLDAAVASMQVISAKPTISAAERQTEDDSIVAQAERDLERWLRQFLSKAKEKSKDAATLTGKVFVLRYFTENHVYEILRNGDSHKVLSPKMQSTIKELLAKIEPAKVALENQLQ